MNCPLGGGRFWARAPARWPSARYPGYLHRLVLRWVCLHLGVLSGPWVFSHAVAPSCVAFFGLRASWSPAPLA